MKTGKYSPTNIQDQKLQFTEYTFTIDGEPVAKGRPRVLKNGHTYTPEKTREAEEAIGWAFKAAYPGNEVDAEADFTVRVHFFVTDYKNGKARKFDLDNGLKLILDALNGIVWADDNQIDSLLGDKIKSTTGQIQIIIRKSVWK